MWMRKWKKKQKLSKKPSWKDRKQQEIVEKMEASKVTANLYVLEDHAELKQTKQVPASIRANRKVLSELVGYSRHEGRRRRSGGVSILKRMPMRLLYYGGNVLLHGNLIQPLLQQTRTFSNWYYHSNLAQQAQGQQASNTDTQMEQSRLEYTISELEKNLKDPNCTRDNDDVMTELRQSQRDLSRLKWK
jgi:hypothetical protein